MLAAGDDPQDTQRLTHLEGWPKFEVLKPGSDFRYSEHKYTIKQSGELSRRRWMKSRWIFPAIWDRDLDFCSGPTPLRKTLLLFGC